MPSPIVRPRLPRGVRWAGCLVAACVVGAVLAASPGAAVVLLGAAGAFALVPLGHRRLLMILIGASFVTLFRFQILGVHLRTEHLVLMVCLCAMVLGGRGPALAAAAGDRTVVLFGVFVLWSAIVSVLQAEQVTESLQIVGWLGLNWLLLVVLVGSGQDASTIARWGTLWAGAAAGLAIALWVLWKVAGTRLGVAAESLTGATAATGLSFEANLLGSTLALWGFLALTGVRSIADRTRSLVLVLCTVGIALSLTRAAMAGVAAGLVVWATLSGRQARRRIFRFAGVAVLAVAALVTTAPSVARPLSAKAHELLDFGSGTGKTRADSWKTALGDLRGSDLLFGLGVNSFGQRHLEPTLPDNPQPAYLANLPLQILYDDGIVGVILVASLVWSIRPKRGIDGRALGLLTVYLACAIATSPFWFATTWIFVGMAVIHRRSPSGTHDSPGDARKAFAGSSGVPTPGRLASSRTGTRHLAQEERRLVPIADGIESASVPFELLDPVGREGHPRRISDGTSTSQWDPQPVVLAAPELERGRVVDHPADAETGSSRQPSEAHGAVQEEMARGVELDPVHAVGAPGERTGEGDTNDQQALRADEPVKRSEDRRGIGHVLKRVVEHDEVEGF